MEGRSLAVIKASLAIVQEAEGGFELQPDEEPHTAEAIWMPEVSLNPGQCLLFNLGCL